MLDPRRTQPCEAMLIDGELPAQELFGGESITLAGFLQTQQPSPYGCDDLGLSTNDPPPGGGRRKIGNG
jgi:hypothetical protein